MDEENNNSLEEMNLDDFDSSMHEGMQQESQMSDEQFAEPRNNRNHRRKRKEKERIESIISDNKMKGYQNQQLVELLQEKENQLAEARALAEQNAHYSNMYYEKSLEENENRLSKELKNAKEEGDVEKEIEIQRQLIDIGALKQTQRLSKTINRRQPQVENYQPNLYPQQQPPLAPQQLNQQQYYNEHEEEWLEDNPWANPQSPAYNPQLSNKFRELVEVSNMKLSYNNMSDFIGTREYFNILTEEMDKTFGFQKNRNNNESENEEYNEDYADSRNQHQERSNNMRSYSVAPVTKRGTSMADRYLSRNNFEGTTSTQAEEYLARKMAPIYSSFKKKTLSDKELMAELKMGKKLAMEAEREKARERELMMNMGF